MKQLKKLLSRSAKVRRRRRTLLNISITILGWIVEFLGFFLIFLGSFILGHDNAIITLSLQTFTVLIYFIVCPSVLLINSYEMKSKIVNDSIYLRFINRFSCCSTVDEPDNADDHTDADKEASNVSNNAEPEEINQDVDVSSLNTNLTLKFLKQLPFSEENEFPDQI